MSSISHVPVKEQIHVPICKKTKWMPEEDKLLQQGIDLFGIGQWTKISEAMPGRSAKQCRERWTGQLDPSLSHSEWTNEEDAHLRKLHSTLGNSWAKIASKMPGRAANAVKNRFRFITKKMAKAHSNTEQPKQTAQRSIELSPDTIITVDDFFLISAFETEDWI